MTLQEAIEAYIEQFDEGPPIFGLSDEEAVRRIQQSLESGEKMLAPDQSLGDDQLS